MEQLTVTIKIHYTVNYYIAKAIRFIAGSKLAIKFLKGKKAGTYTLGSGPKQTLVL